MSTSPLFDPLLARAHAWPARHPRLLSQVRRNALRAWDADLPNRGGPAPGAAVARRELAGRACVMVIATASFGLWYGIVELAAALV
jgi:hypothetical protein